MPLMDGTGPTGSGPDGRRSGPCGDGYAGQRRGGGFRRGGRGLRHAILSPEEEKKILEQRKGWLERQLEEVDKRLQSQDQ